MKNKNRSKEISAASIIFQVIVGIILITYSISIIFTLFWGLLTSLKNPVYDFQLQKNILGFPNLQYSQEEVFKLRNYTILLDNFDWTSKVKYYSAIVGDYVQHENKNTLFSVIANTLIYALGLSILSTLFTCFVAYACAKYRHYKAAKIIYVTNLVFMMLPVVGSSSPTITLLRETNLYDSFFGIFLQGGPVFTGMYFLVFHAAFVDMSNSYSEAAEIDGASQYRILFSIIVPLVSKTLITIIVIKFVGYWNDYQTPSLYMPTHPTLSIAVWLKVFQSSNPQLNKVPVKIAACMILAIPILILFVILRDKFMGNISAGGVKE